MTDSRNIGRRLREIYGPVVFEPLPEEFLHLLERLEEKKKQSDG